MNILVIGAGAVGSLVSARLAYGNTQYARSEITLVGRPLFVQAVLQQGGIRIEQGQRHQRVANLRIVSTIQQAFNERSGDFDAVIFTVKGFDTTAALHELNAALHSHHHKPPLLLSLQIGVGNEETIARNIAPAYVVAGVITTPVTVVSPGIVRVENAQFNIGLSPWHPAVPQERFEALHLWLHRAGFDVVLYPDPQALKWTKLLMNMVGNASSAILDVTPADLFARPELVNIEIDAWREALNVMQASGIEPVNIGSYPFTVLAPLIRHLPKAMLRPMLRGQVREVRGKKMPSLQLGLYHNDLERRKKSEIDWLNGAVVQQGERVGVPTPVNRMLTDTLRHIVRHPQQSSRWAGETLRMIVTVDEYCSRERR